MRARKGKEKRTGEDRRRDITRGEERNGEHRKVIKTRRKN